MIVLAMLAALAGNTGSATEYASADDCAILVEVGKVEAAWGPKGPNQPLVAEGELKDGTVYIQACNWAALGVGAPVLLKSGQTGPRFAVDKPRYTKGGKAAAVEVNFVVWQGPGFPPFLSVRRCDLRKTNGHWRLTKCTQGPIT